jgi:dTDP-D-glucose 4,6-dehydratase
MEEGDVTGRFVMVWSIAATAVATWTDIGSQIDLQLTLSGHPQRPQLDPEQEKYLTFVEDRAFNDLRYSVNSSALKQLGWKEQVSWEDGLRMTVDWYKEHTKRYGNIESALVPHPRAGGVTGSPPELFL